METSDYFKSMDEIKALVEKYENVLSNDDYNTLKKIMGLGEQEGDYKDVIGIGKIDTSIVKLIKTLNKTNFATLSSCSGIRSEHNKWREDHSGYISFLNDGNEVRCNIIKEFAKQKQFKFEELEVYLRPAYTIRIYGTDEAKTNAWHSLLECIIQTYTY